MSSKLVEFTERINIALAQIELVKKPEELYMPVRYCLRHGGKRVRPLMALLACDMFDGDIENVMGPALGMELFHNFTLMHDDLMDQAPIRRGVLAVHKKWSSNTAILSGDVMFALAVKYISQTPDKHLKTIIQLFNKIVIEVCEGQQYDMNFETMDKVTEEDYLQMIRLKTAVLPAACLQTGAIIAGASEQDTQLLYDFGENIGMAFQIKDDWLDCFGDEETFGKKSGGDIAANKKTWLYIKSFDLANKNQLRILRDAFTNRFSNTDEKISVVRNVYFDLKLNELALEKMEEYYEKAFRQLNALKLPDGKKQEMESLAYKLFNRTI